MHIPYSLIWSAHNGDDAPQKSGISLFVYRLKILSLGSRVCRMRTYGIYLSTYFWLLNGNYAIFCKPTVNLHAALSIVLIDNVAELHVFYATFSSVCNGQLLSWMCDVITQCCACPLSCLCEFNERNHAFACSDWGRKGKERKGTKAVSFQQRCSRYGSVAVRQETGLRTPRGELLNLKLIQLLKLLDMGGRLCVSLVTFGWKTMWPVSK
jgi:hypothetical protein